MNVKIWAGILAVISLMSWGPAYPEDKDPPIEPDDIELSLHPAYRQKTDWVFSLPFGNSVGYFGLRFGYNLIDTGRVDLRLASGLGFHSQESPAGNRYDVVDYEIVLHLGGTIWGPHGLFQKGRYGGVHSKRFRASKDSVHLGTSEHMGYGFSYLVGYNYTRRTLNGAVGLNVGGGVAYTSDPTIQDDFGTGTFFKWEVELYVAF